MAQDSENKFKGQLFNKPGGPDVYKNCNIDYKGVDVTPEVFLSVLKGDETSLAGKGNGKLLKTDKDSKIFIFFTDHGAPGLLGFPNGMLFADDLMKALKYMNEN